MSYILFGLILSGLAPLEGICTPNGNSLNEDIGFHAWLVCAHELAHK